MVGSDCDCFLSKTTRQRQKVLIAITLLVLPGLLVVYHFEPRQPLACERPGCARSLAAVNQSAAAGTDRPPPLAVTEGQATGAPPPAAAAADANATDDDDDNAADDEAEWTKLKPSSWPQVVTALFDYIEKPHAHCEKAVRIGGQPNYKEKKFDGYKWVCLDPEYGILQTNSCLIYSFGVDHDWSFDDNVQLLQCEIHAFDPSIGQKDHKRSSHIFFHNVGVGGKNEVRTIPIGLFARRRWDVRTYENIVRYLRYENRTVHYLKIDVEGSEWTMMAHMMTRTPHLLRHVRQLAVEVHMQAGVTGGVGSTSLSAWTAYLAIFRRLENMGFKLYHSEMNPYHKPEKLFPDIDRLVARVYEMVWLYQPNR